MGYHVDNSWAKRYDLAIRKLIGPHILIKAPLWEDRLHATDFVLRSSDLKFSARMRRPGRELSYFPGPYGLKLRYERDNGTTTEYFKLKEEKHVTHYFYGHAPDVNNSELINPWLLLDMRIWREEEEKVYPRRVIHHGDGSFIVYDVRKFSPLFVVASQGLPSAPNGTFDSWKLNRDPGIWP